MKNGLKSTRPFQWTESVSQHSNVGKGMDLSTEMCPTPLQQAAVYSLGAAASLQFTPKVCCRKAETCRAIKQEEFPRVGFRSSNYHRFAQMFLASQVLCVFILHQDIPPNQVTYSEMTTIRDIARTSHISHSNTCEQHVLTACCEC